MPTFKDRKGGEWLVEVTAGTVKRVRSMLGVDLLKAVEGGELLNRMISDPVFLVDLLYVVCKPQADAKQISDYEFGELMAGESILHATNALMEALISFSPSPKDQANFGRVWKALTDTMDKARDLAGARIATELPGLVERALESVGSSSTSTPESSDSTPAPSP
jgi:hypothetical protein